MSDVPSPEPWVAPGSDLVGVRREENLLRRFPNQPKMLVGDRVPRFRIFIPTSSDAGGLSMSREAGYNTPEDVLNRGGTGVRRFGGLISVVAGHVIDNAMHVELHPVENSPGHIQIPELNRSDYDRPETNRMVLDLADAMARGAILRIPPRLPEEPRPIEEFPTP